MSSLHIIVRARHNGEKDLITDNYMNNSFRSQIIQYLTSIHQEDSSHDLYHALRVEKTALELCRIEEQGNPLVISTAALLHDIVSFPKSDPRRKESSFYSAEKASEFLKSLDFSDDQIKKIHHCIHAHSFSAQVVAKTIDAKIVQDADRMEALGAIGIARCFYTSGLLKRDLFHPVDPLAYSRELDDLQYALDHFYVKLLKLPEMMQTQSGKMMAKKRTAFLEHFAQTLVDEISI